MLNYRELIAPNKGVLKIKDLEGYNPIGKGSDGSVFQLTPERCIKVFVKEETKELELKALQVGQLSPVIPRLYEDGVNYIIMEYINGISLPGYLKAKKQLPEPIVEKILTLLAEMKRVGFHRCDTEVRHILFNENMEVKVIDLKRAFGPIRSNPTKLLKGIDKKGYLNEFMQHVNKLSPTLYEEWGKSYRF